jgi:hypothetical protein
MSGRQDDMRISTAERLKALDVLSDQFTQGRLGVDEFSARSAAIIAAVNRGDLRPVFVDLPVEFAASFADVVECRIREADRAARDAASDVAAEKRARILAADDLGGRLIQLAEYLTEKVAPRPVALAPQDPTRGSRVKRPWRTPTRLSPSGFELPCCAGLQVLRPDGLLWDVDSGYIDLRAAFLRAPSARDSEVSVGLYEFFPSPKSALRDHGPWALRARMRRHYARDSYREEMDPTDALTALAAEIVRRS